MKFNWGTGIVMAFVAFIAFIMYFVIRMNTDDHSDHELVTKDYYNKELAYQKQIDAEKNAVAMNAQLKVTKTPEGLIIQFPEKYSAQEITGTVSLYRPSNRHLDVDFPISLSNTHLLIPDNQLVDGRWDINIAWQYKGTPFLHREKLTY